MTGSGNICQLIRLSQSFNEARADSPGRLSEADRNTLVTLGFNEARADSPGRPDGIGGEQPFEFASMRPGPIRPGDETHLVTGDARQMSYGFNEARADSPGRYCA